MSYHGHFESQKPQKQPKKKKKLWLKILLIILVVILVAVIAVVAVGVSSYKSMLSKVNYVTMPVRETTEAVVTEVSEDDGTEETTAETEETTVETTIPQMTAEDIVNILIVGQSGRAGEDAALADTMILASLNKYTNTLTLTSFLRDTYVDLPDYRATNGTLHTCGWNKLTSCYALGYSWDGTAGAMDMMNTCLYNNFGVEIDYNVEIDFDCFIKVVDMLGGVGLSITQEEADYLNADDRFVYGEYQAGKVTLDGSAALSYARMRKAAGDNDSDIKRTERQRKLIKALLGNIGGSSLAQLQNMMNEVLPMITTNMPADKITELLFEFVPMLPGLAFEGGTCPVAGTYWPELKSTPDGDLYVLCFEAPQQKKLMRAITEAELYE